MRKTELFRSKSCTLARITTPATNSDPNSGLSVKAPKSMSPPRALNTNSTSRYQYQYNREEEEDDDDDDDEDTMDEEEEEEGDAETEYLSLRRRRRRGANKNNNNYSNDESSSPIMTPFNFIGIEEQTNNSPHSHQFPPLVAILLTALRRSLLVTCSVARDDVSNHLDIDWPTDVRHVSHVTFDPFNGFLGLPLELQNDLPCKVPSASASVFGVSAQSMQCSYDHRGNSVPTILLMMQNSLYSEGGLQAEGIFRINAENSQEENVRNHLNRGVVPRGIDVHCLAGLIKAWFRELPTGVLDSLTPEQVMHCNTEEECTQLGNLLPSTEAALLDWAINLMADIVLHEHYNKMNSRNIAMVFAPNMTQMADPLTALIHAVQVMNFLKTLINKTLREREESGSRICILQSTAHPPDYKHSSDLDVVMQPKLASDGHCIIGSVACKLFSDGTSDCLESETGEKGSFGIKSDARKATGSIPSNISPITCKSQSLECNLRDGFGDGGVDEGIFQKLSLRKGVRKLCRHPVFQLSKAVKKKTDSGIVNSRGGESWM